MSRDKKVNDNNILSVIVPIRVSDENAYLLDRLRINLSLDKYCPEIVSFIVVDDGSSKHYAEKMEDICLELQYKYLRLETEEQRFSIGRCRNVGAQYAKTKYIFFQDIDLLPTDYFYQELLDEVFVQELQKNAANFVMVPCIYLTEQASKDFFDYPENLRRRYYFNKCLEGDESVFEKYSSGTSACVYDRHFYMMGGGNDPDFEGWGFDDLEYNTRQIRKAKKFPIPENWFLDKGNFSSQDEFIGWKSVYKLHGDLSWNKGLVLFHQWHPVDKASEYQVRRTQNEILFNQKIRNFKQDGIEPEPLADIGAGNTLLFRQNAFTFNRYIRPLLGEVFLKSEADFKSWEALRSYLMAQNIDRIVFHNPYANEEMLQIYRWARQYDVPYIVAERGALDDSVFYDVNGFLCDSTSYDESVWNVPLSNEQASLVNVYIEEKRRNPNSLEFQPARQEIDKIRGLLGMDTDKKVLFVPFQRPGDTVTKFFKKDLTYSQFEDMVADLAKVLPKDWVMVVKKHPLEDSFKMPCNAYDAGEVHINDLLELSDLIVTFNSGVGVLAMLWNKPVVTMGKAFYHFPDINYSASNVADILTILDKKYSPDSEKIQRFLCFLLERFYSFGELITRQTRMADGSRMTATTNIKFWRLIWPDSEWPVCLPKSSNNPMVSWSSILFDVYRCSENRNSSVLNIGCVNRLWCMPFWTKNRFFRKLRKLIFSPISFFKDMLAKRNDK